MTIETAAGHASAPSALRVELAIRAATLAKAVLEVVGMDPSLVWLQIHEIAKQLLEMEQCVGKKGGR